MIDIMFVSNHSGFYGSEKNFIKIIEILNDGLSSKENILIINNATGKEVAGYPCRVVVEKFNIISQKTKAISLIGITKWISRLMYYHPRLVICNISLIPELYLAARLCKIDIIIFIRESLIDYKNLFWIYKKYLLFCAKKIICNSKYTMSMFEGSSKVRLLYNYTEIEGDNVITVKDFIYRLKCLKKKPVFLYIGRYSYRKGLDTIISIIKTLENGRINLEFDFYGDKRLGDDNIFNELMELKSKCKYIQIEINGFETNIKEIMQNASCLLATSTLPETFGMTVLEAITLGLPVIASDQQSYKEILTTNYSLFYQNEDQFIANVFKIINMDDMEYLKLQESLYNRSKYFSKEEYKRSLIREIVDVVDNSSKS